VKLGSAEEQKSGFDADSFCPEPLFLTSDRPLFADSKPCDGHMASNEQCLAGCPAGT